MGLAFAIVIGFLGFVGISHQESMAHKYIEMVHQQEQIKKKSIKHHSQKPKKVIARLDGLEIRNLKG